MDKVTIILIKISSKYSINLGILDLVEGDFLKLTSIIYEIPILLYFI